MLIFPAIDLYEKKAVRLLKGDYNQVTVYSDSPLEVAEKFKSLGATHIHMVDLDGAKEGRPVNTKIYTDVAEKTNLKVELGGGIRSLETIQEYLNMGISRVILGSVALKNPKLVRDAVEKFGSEKIAVGIDAVNGMVATEGWLDTSDVNYIDLANEMISAGVKYFIFTDISKDGTLSGVNKEQLKALADATSGKCCITASGGVHTMADIIACKEMGLYGTICGKSIYKGTLNLKEAIEYSEKQ